MSSSASSMRVCANLSRSSLTSSGVRVARTPRRLASSVSLAMAAMACGVPILIGAHTGHLDLVSDRLAFVIPVQSIADRADWGEVSVADVVEGLEQVWRDRESARQKGLAAAAHLRDWTWEQQSLKLLEILQELIR